VIRTRGLLSARPDDGSRFDPHRSTRRRIIDIEQPRSLPASAQQPDAGRGNRRLVGTAGTPPIGARLTHPEREPLRTTESAKPRCRRTSVDEARREARASPAGLRTSLCRSLTSLYRDARASLRGAGASPTGLRTSLCRSLTSLYGDARASLRGAGASPAGLRTSLCRSLTSLYRDARASLRGAGVLPEIEQHVAERKVRSAGRLQRAGVVAVSE